MRGWNAPQLFSLSRRLLMEAAGRFCLCGANPQRFFFELDKRLTNRDS